MTAALTVLIAFVLGAAVAVLGLNKIIGKRSWREGYLWGFSVAWEEKAKADMIATQKRAKELRRRRPKFVVIKGDK